MFIFDSKKYNKISLLNKNEFVKNTPFPHIFLKNFLPKKEAEKIYKSFPKFNNQKAWDIDKSKKINFTKKKRVQYDESKFPIIIRNFFREISSRHFLLFLESLTGINGLVPDPYFIGGGIHLYNGSGNLKSHTDFRWNAKLKMERVLNVLFYFNKNYNYKNGGLFELFDKKNKKKIKSYKPLFNSCLIFNTCEHSFHGVSPITNTRKKRLSLQAYYYRVTLDPLKINNPNAAIYKPKSRPSKISDFSLKKSSYYSQNSKNYNKM